MIVRAIRAVLVLLGLSLNFQTLASEADHGHKIPHHHVALFLGAGKEVQDQHEDEIGIALGLEYEYRFHQKWGVGGVVEGLGKDTLRDAVIAVPISFHPGGNWRLFAGPGYEFSGTKDHALIRVGIGYEIPVGNGWTLAPEAIADLIDGGKEVYLLGLAIGRDF